MVVIFDLDDTLYPEHTFVESGFKAVANFLCDKCERNSDYIFQSLLTIFQFQGRGKVFNTFLKNERIFTKKNLDSCLKTYRHHKPDIVLFPEAEELLKALPSPLYLVTDGHKVVQANKIEALKIESFFKKTLITRRYGIKNEKPSIYCFDIIRKLESCSWRDMVYIGDNPAKDFVGLNPFGVKTIRVLTGMHRNKVAKDGFEAQYCINSLADVPKYLI